MTDRVTTEHLASWRREIAEQGDGEFLDLIAQAIAPRLMAQIERLWAERDSARKDAMAAAAVALARCLSDVASYNHGGCPTYKYAEARAFLARLRRAAGAGA